MMELLMIECNFLIPRMGHRMATLKLLPSHCNFHKVTHIIFLAGIGWSVKQAHKNSF